MTEVIGVRFRDAGKVYTFDPAGNQLAKGSTVVVETARGVECGTVAEPNHSVEDDQIVAPLKSILREANDRDLHNLRRTARRKRKPSRSARRKSWNMAST